MGLRASRSGTMADEGFEEEDPREDHKDDKSVLILRLVRAKYERLCNLFEASVPTGVGKKLYTKEIISSEAHRSLDSQGISKSQQAIRLMDAVMLTLKADDTDETFMAFLDVLRSISGPCKRLADSLYSECELRAMHALGKKLRSENVMKVYETRNTASRLVG